MLQKQDIGWGQGWRYVLGREISKEPKTRKSLVYSKNRIAEDLAGGERARERAVELRMDIRALRPW